MVVQETNGTEAALTQFGRQPPSHHAYTSAGPNKHAGGLLTLASKKKLPTPSTPVHIAHGRVLLTYLRSNNFIAIIFNVHNEDINELELRRRKSRFRDARQAQDDDEEMCTFTILVGDFNFLAPGEHTAHVGINTHNKPPPTNQKHQQEAWRWKGIIGTLTELEQPCYTRCGASKEHPSILSRIDRIYTSIPPWMLKSFRIHTELILKPQKASFETLSDHGSVGTALSSRTLLPTHLRPIPSWLTPHPIFASTLNEIELNMGLDDDDDDIIS